jgi:serine protease AprX
MTAVLPGVRWGRDARATMLVAALLAALLVTVHPGAGATGAISVSTGAEELVRVIVRMVPGAAPVDVRPVGGTVTQQLPIINGFAAEVPAAAVPALESAAGVTAVTPAYELQPLTTSSGDMSATELGSLYNVARMIGADDMWRSGFTGAGVDVAVIDTGAVPVNGLTWPGKVVLGPDLSFESQSDEHSYLDTYGHGTAMSGLIAGRDDEITDPATNDGAGFQGIAPDARIVSVKVGAATGAVDVSQVIAAIDWVVQHRTSGDLDIRVLNLSYGTDSIQSASVDPLSYAVDVAWRHGIVVVAATGNDGRGFNLAMPAQNPNVIAVGASDHRDSFDTLDDRPASFSTYATGQRRPDFLAPGVGVVGLRNPGSHLDELHPQAVRGDRFFRGSGTSQAAAVTSGAVALLLSQRPDLTPDQVKALLRNTATSLRGTSNNAQGAGLINLRSARTAAAPSSTQALASPTGTGSLDAARGTAILTADGVDLRGEQDIFAQSWNGSRWTQEAWTGTSWQDGWWNGSRWTGSRWTTDEEAWAGSRWTGSRWTGSRWTGSRWTGSSWTGGSWEDDSWAGSRWTGSRWTFDDTWTGSRWTGSRWTGSRWTGSRWTSAWGGSGWE